MNKYLTRLVITSALLLTPAAVSTGDVAWTFEDAHALYPEFQDTGVSTIQPVGYDPGDPNSVLGYAIPATGGSLEYLESARMALDPSGQPTGTYGMHFYGPPGHFDPNFGNNLDGHPNTLNGIADTPDAQQGHPTQSHADENFDDDFTLAAYIRAENIATASNGIMLMGNYSGSILPRMGMWHWRLLSGSGAMQFGIYWSDGANHNLFSGEDTIGVGLSDGVVYHVAVRYDHGVVTFFVDGLDTGATSHTSGTPPFPTSGWNTQNFSQDPGPGLIPFEAVVWIGGVGAPQFSEFRGDMDNVMMFDRALTDQEILDLAGGPKCGSFGFLPEDLDKDCYVDDTDLGLLFGQWLECTDPAIVDCD
jgi:hypothetical protein